MSFFGCYTSQHSLEYIPQTFTVSALTVAGEVGLLVDKLCEIYTWVFGFSLCSKRPDVYFIFIGYTLYHWKSNDTKNLQLCSCGDGKYSLCVQIGKHHCLFSDEEWCISLSLYVPMGVKGRSMSEGFPIACFHFH